MTEQELTYENLLQAVEYLDRYEPKGYSRWRDLCLPVECGQAWKDGDAKEFMRLVRKAKGW